jgi:hypothetical protein
VVEVGAGPRAGVGMTFSFMFNVWLHFTVRSFISAAASARAA